MSQVKVKILKDWGTHKKDDQVIMHKTTAEACNKHCSIIGEAERDEDGNLPKLKRSAKTTRRQSSKKED